MAEVAISAVIGIERNHKLVRCNVKKYIKSHLHIVQIGLKWKKKIITIEENIAFFM